MRTTIIYVDGACSGNPGKGGVGAVIITPDQETLEVSFGFRRTTNQRMEILAAAIALETVLEEDIPCEEVVVRTDSQYVVETMAGRFRVKSNQDLWDRLRKAVANQGRVKVTFEKVSGHSGDAFNEKADRLAVKAYRSAFLNEDVGHVPRFAPDKSDGEYRLPPSEVKTDVEPHIVNLVLSNDGQKTCRSIQVNFSDGKSVTAVPGEGEGGYRLSGSLEHMPAAGRRLDEYLLRWLHGK